MTVRRLIAILFALGLVAAGCGGKGGVSAARSTASADAAAGDATTGTTIPPDTSFVATANGPTVDVYDSPSSATPSQSLANPTESGAPAVFLLMDQNFTGPWYHVWLPVRPNGSNGYIKAAQVNLSRHRWHIKVELGAHQITVTNAGAVFLQEPVGVGTEDTPTPGGVFYIKELLQPPTPDGPYGPYAYGLSGFSNQLTDFNGGQGVIGIHGTNEPDKIGTDVSHGCIRMSNDGITKLAQTLPLGVPVEIDA
jgi:lipoprotein-anchoring transpeptidase ErfK/SrfK